MLVLTRKLQQQIKIGQQITVTILRVKGQTVRVGIEAPRDVRVVRGELPPESLSEGAAAQLEGGIETTTLVFTGTQQEDGDSVADAGGEEGNEESGSHEERADCETVSSPASPRLPQRRRFDRAGNPPLRLAMSSATLAK